MTGKYERRIAMKFRGKVLALHAMATFSYQSPNVIGAVVYVDGEEIDSFLGKCPIREEYCGMPATKAYIQSTASIDENYGTYEAMLLAFGEFFRKNNSSAIILMKDVHIPDAKNLFSSMYRYCALNRFEMLHPILDIYSILGERDFWPDIEKYLSDNNVGPLPGPNGVRNPLYDCRTIATCYMHFMADL
jgi:hypothetical protein